MAVYGSGPYGAGLYGVGFTAIVQRYPSLFIDKGYNRRPRRDLYYPPTKIK